MIRIFSLNDLGRVNFYVTRGKSIFSPPFESLCIKVIKEKGFVVYVFSAKDGLRNFFYVVIPLNKFHFFNYFI